MSIALRRSRRRSPIQLDELKPLLDERCAEIAERLLGKPRSAGPIEHRWGRKNEIALVVQPGHPKLGTWFDHYGTHAIQGGKMLDLIMRVRSLDLPAAIEEAAAIIRFVPSSAHTPRLANDAATGRRRAPDPEAERVAREKREQAQAAAAAEAAAEAAKKLERAIRYWSGASPARRDDPVDRYLERRRIPGNWTGIRSHAGLFDPDSRRRYPAVVAAIRSRPTAPIASVQVIYLDPDGTKPDIPVPKRTMAVARGNACWLTDIECPIALVAEGWENAASAWIMLGRPTDVTPVGACGGGSLTSWHPPDFIKAVLIVGDHDHLDEQGRNTGRIMANKLATRLEEENRLLTGVWFNRIRGLDANDLLRRDKRPSDLARALDRLRACLPTRLVADEGQRQRAQRRPQARDLRASRL